MQVCGKESGTEIVKGIKPFPLAFAFSRAMPPSKENSLWKRTARTKRFGIGSCSTGTTLPQERACTSADFTPFPCASTAPAAEAPTSHPRPHPTPWGWASTRSSLRQRLLIMPVGVPSADTCLPGPKLPTSFTGASYRHHIWTAVNHPCPRPESCRWPASERFSPPNPQ